MSGIVAGDGKRPPFWSVMIPTWNPNRQFLAEALQRVMAAGLAPADMQIALVDDASPAFEAAGFIRELGYERVEVHRSADRLGIAGNWNRCVELARGRWVHILHQDDRVLPDFYRALARGIEKEPGIGAAFTQHAFIDEAGRMVRRGHMPPREAGILEDWLQHIFVNLTVQCAAIVLRRDVVKQLGGFDASLTYCLDWDMWQKIALAYPIWYEPSPLAEQRLHRDSQSSALQQTAAKWREIAVVIARARSRLEPSETVWVMPALRQTYLRLALRHLCQAMARRDGLSALQEALGCLRVVRPSDAWAVARHRHPPGFKPAYEAGHRPPRRAQAVPARRRILFIAGTSEPGGIHIHTADVAGALAESEIDVAILNVSTDYFSQLLKGSPVRVLSVTPPDIHPAIPCFLAWRRILAPYAGWDMVLCRGKAGKTPAPELLAARSRAARLYTIEHRPAEPEQQRRLWRLLRRRVASLLIRRAIAVSEETRRSAIASGYLTAGRVVACLNWVDAAAFRTSAEARSQMRQRLGIGERETVVGFLGRLAPEKRVDALIEAFAALDEAHDLRLVLVGDGWKKAELQQQCQNLGIAGQVTFAGWQPEAGEALSALDIFVLPSLIEGFPLGLLEAMAAGRLCLAHAMDSARLAIQDGATGLLGDFSTTEGLTKILQRALRLSPAERAAIGAAASASIATGFARHRRLPAVLVALEAPDAAALAARTDRPAVARRFAFSP